MTPAEARRREMTIAEQIAELERRNDGTDCEGFAAGCADLVLKHARLFAAAEAMRDVLKRAKTMTGHAHWDDTQLRGAGCPLCIKQRVICEEIDAALALAEPEGAAR